MFSKIFFQLIVLCSKTYKEDICKYSFLRSTVCDFLKRFFLRLFAFQIIFKSKLCLQYSQFITTGLYDVKKFGKISLKGQCHQIIDPWFFLIITHLGSLFLQYMLKYLFIQYKVFISWKYWHVQKTARCHGHGRIKHYGVKDTKEFSGFL